MWIPKWPKDQKVFRIVRNVANEQAALAAVAICDVNGKAKETFSPNDIAVIYVEWHLYKPFFDKAMSSEILFFDNRGIVVSGKSAYQTSQGPVINKDKNQWKLRARYVVRLKLAPGGYSTKVSLTEVGKEDYFAYRRGEMAYADFAKKKNIVSVGDAGHLKIAKQHNLRHQGLTDLIDSVRVSQSALKTSEYQHKQTPATTETDLPALIHVTHHKSGSQWIYKILRAAFPDQVVTPMLYEAHFLNAPVEQGKVYPTVYATKEKFDKALLPKKWYRFVIVRDLRDTLVSAYFSIKFSHPTIGPINQWRELLNRVDQEEGMLWVLKEWLPQAAKIQISWWEAGERIIRYEDLLRDDVNILKRIIIDEAQWPITPERLEEIIVAHRFENLTGRQRGKEELSAHERKGIAGDWKNYFTPRLKEVFKTRYGGILVALGYEKDLSW